MSEWEREIESGVEEGGSIERDQEGNGRGVEVRGDVGSVRGLNSVNPSNPASPGFRLTERDYDIFGFLLDQKFASLEALYFRFFETRESPTDPIPKQCYVARQRLGILKRAGLLISQRVYSEGKSLYLLSALGYQVFRNRRDMDAYAPPPAGVDFRNYEHDQAVTYCRVAIERRHKAMKWFCERRLRMHGFQVEGVRHELPSSVVPDAIFISSKGERIAFELEFTHRKKSRYAFKVSEYERVMFGSNPLIHRVLFVGGNERVSRDLGEVIGRRQEFLLESYAHFLGRLFPPEQALVVIGAAQRSQGEG